MGAQILLVEDNPTSRDLLTYLLVAFGHDVVAAGSGEAALDRLSEMRPDLIICDLDLPGIKGYEIVHRLRIDPALATIPVVAVTAMAMVGEREKVLAAGFDGYLSKPIDPETFCGQLDRFMPAAQASMARGRTTLAPATSRAAYAPPAVTLLILDSIGRNGAMIRGLLAGMGFRLLSAADAPTALRLARSELPDLIVTDAPTNPALGCDLLRAARADLALTRTPFAYLTDCVRGAIEDAPADELGAVIISRGLPPSELRRQILACLPAALRPLETPLSKAS
jgi:two-component system cell cycle response regulator